MKKVRFIAPLLLGLCTAGVANAEVNTIFGGYSFQTSGIVKSKGVHIGYQQEGAEGIGIVLTGTYLAAKETLLDDNELIKGKATYISALVGPSYRFSPNFNVYAQVGLARNQEKLTGYEYDDGTYLGTISSNGTGIAIAVGSTIHFNEQFSIGVSYERALFSDYYKGSGFQGGLWRVSAGYSY